MDVKPWSLLILALLGRPLWAGFPIERIFGPEIPGKYKHPASIAELDNGDLYLVYYGGSGEYAGDTAVFGARRVKGGTTWSQPAPIATTDQQSVGNAVIWQAPAGLVWLFYVVRTGATWSSSRIEIKTSRDGARTWTAPTVLAAQAGMMVRSRPLVLASGEYLLPAYHETGNDREAVGPGSTSVFLRFEPRKGAWSESGRVRSRAGNIQPAVIERAPGQLVCYCRRGGGYGPTQDGYIVRAESTDAGHTWSPGRDTAFPNPNAAVDLLRLQSGHWLLVYNDSMTRRRPLTAALSLDEEKTWAVRRNLVEGPGDFAYPYMIQTRDGRIHVVFTSNRRSVVNRIVFREEDLRDATNPTR